MIRSQGKTKLHWDLIIIVFSVYQSVTVPLDMAFSPDIFNAPEFRTLNSLIDLVFIFDILIRFRTTNIDQISGEENTDAMLISKKYVTSSSFYIDILSSIPFYDLFGGGVFTQLLGALKLLRIARISSVIMNLN